MAHSVKASLCHTVLNLVLKTFAIEAVDLVKPSARVQWFKLISGQFYNIGSVFIHLMNFTTYASTVLWKYLQLVSRKVSLYMFGLYSSNVLTRVVFFRALWNSESVSIDSESFVSPITTVKSIGNCKILHIQWKFWHDIQTRMVRLTNQNGNVQYVLLNFLSSITRSLEKK